MQARVTALVINLFPVRSGEYNDKASTTKDRRTRRNIERIAGKKAFTTKDTKDTKEQGKVSKETTKRCGACDGHGYHLAAQ
jgi:hypothetical protein